MRDKVRLGVVVSHPIQHFAPYYRAIAQEGSVQIKAFFCSRIGLDNIRDPDGMGVEISWATDLLGGYDHVFLPEAPSVKRTTFRDVDNPSVTAYLDEYEPNVLLLHGYAQKTLVRVVLWARRRGVPIMMISDRTFFGRTTVPRRAARRLVLPLILRQFRALLVFGDSIEQFYSSFGARREQIFRVPIMLDQAFWRARENRTEVRALMRAELGLENEFAVMYVGKFYSTKRPDDLIAALEIINERKTTKRRVTMMFAGDGETRAALEQRARRSNLPARFLGFVNVDQLPRMYCAADALAHPASNECYGAITVEAAVCGLPLVLSDRVGAIGTTSIARPGENTLVYPCTDVKALATAIEKLANDPDLVSRTSGASLRFSEDHDGRMSVGNTLRAIADCVSDSRAGILRPTEKRHSASV
jgi:glycosyltransferase involved in cell wall biosynthesis